MKTVKERIIEWVREEYGLVDGVEFNMSDDVRGVKKPSNYNPYKFIDGRLYDVDGARDSDIITMYHYIDVIKEPRLTDEDKEILKRQLEIIPKYDRSDTTIEFVKGDRGVYYHIVCGAKSNPCTSDCLTSFEFVTNFKHVKLYREYTLEELGL